MSLFPARMSRLLVGGHRDHLHAVIDTLHAEGVLHIEDYRDATGITRIGSPLPAGSRVSELLVQLRGLQKSIGSDGTPASPGSHPSPAEVLADAQGATRASIEQVAHLRARLAALDAEESTLRPLAGLPVELSLIPSLRSVRVFVGMARVDPTNALNAKGLTHETHVTANLAVVTIVAVKDAAVAEKALQESGFTSISLPPGLGAGTPAERLTSLSTERTTTTAALAAAEAQQAELRTTWGPRLAAAERQLMGDVEKTQSPLKFGVTDTTFHIEGWVPRSRLGTAKASLQARFGESLYVENLGDAPREHATTDHHKRGEHAHEHGHEHANHEVTGGSDAHAELHPDDHHAADPKDEPPIHLENKGLAKPYEFLLGLLGLPRYKEIDPTKLMLIFFPLFFGLMVGDVAVGIMIMIVGWYLKTNKVFGIGGPAVGRSIFMGGFMSAIVGLFVFGEALGIHFVVSHEATMVEHELSWETILGLNIPFADMAHGFLYKTGSMEGLVEHAGILTPHTTTHLAVGPIVLGWYSKTHDTLALLVWGMIIGLVHVVLGLLLGIRNVYVQHGLTLAIQEKAAWLTLMIGAAMAALGSGIILWLGVGIAVASVVLLYMGAAHVIGVGFIALLEIPGLAGNILSYTRLAAIGASKAGMGIAFANIAFVVIAGHDGVANTSSIVGWVVYFAAFSLILVLAIIAGTLQSLRLQFVEFFGKFFAGGGRPYVPFGRRAT